LKKAYVFARHYLKICTENEISTASAALSYYLTLTFFPLIICLYALLGSNYDKALNVLNFVQRLIPVDTARFIYDFITYVSENNSGPMLATGLAVLVSTSSAAIRSLQSIIGKMQGGQRFHGYRDVLFSLGFSLLFIAAMYFAILVMLTGEDFLILLSRAIPVIDASSSWRYIRFAVLAGIELVIIHSVYAVSKRDTDNYSTIPGAALASFAMVAVSLVFSLFISVSAKYPLVYGSIAAIILLMFWLYLCCMVIYMGAALNITIRDVF